jgi:hypothetical protein
MLMNNRFDDASIMEPYFQRSVFWAVWPSMFSGQNVGVDVAYFDNPAWYNRDRALFKKYLPMVRKLDEAGWQPVTGASIDPPDARIERYGSFARAISRSRSTIPRRERATSRSRSPRGFASARRDWQRGSGSRTSRWSERRRVSRSHSRGRVRRRLGSHRQIVDDLVRREGQRRCRLRWRRDRGAARAVVTTAVPGPASRRRTSPRNRAA